ncbi:DUF6870 family protein [Agathobaculum sp. Marseille-P7918]|uniref:DUF6870 family protein n=1 Tax=Agathobaculum sp. Marseille-P7918 TaxID=2479843 RepID=UPI0035624CC0
MNNQLNISALASIDIQKVNKDELVDVSGLALDPGVPQELRAGYILKSTENPYCFRVGDLGVKLEFLDSAPSLQDALSDFFQRKKSGL